MHETLWESSKSNRANQSLTIHAPKIYVRSRESALLLGGRSSNPTSEPRKIHFCLYLYGDIMNLCR